MRGLSYLVFPAAPEELAKMPLVLIRHEGGIWGATVEEDQGLFVLLPQKHDREFRNLPDEMFAKPDLSKVFAHRPPNRAKPSKLLRQLGPIETMRIGAITVHNGFVKIVHFLHPRCSWLAPNVATDGPAWAVVNDKPVALVMGLAPSFVAKHDISPMSDGGGS